ncbi:MAG: HigA family addiction module antidote protein [Opitutales bacterium]|nr:HigA family addiction module antidote protein [Opitutales bacterium]
MTKDMEQVVQKKRRGRPPLRKVDSRNIELPGDIIVSRFIKPRNITQKQVAEGLGIPLVCFSAMLSGRIRISAEYALRLSLYFGLPVRFWLGLQSEYDEKALDPQTVEKIKSQVKANFSER